MDSTQVKTFCDSAAQLSPQIGAGERKATDDVLVRFKE